MSSAAQRAREILAKSRSVRGQKEIDLFSGKYQKEIQQEIEAAEIEDELDSDYDPNEEDEVFSESETEEEIDEEMKGFIVKDNEVEAPEPVTEEESESDSDEEDSAEDYLDSPVKKVVYYYNTRSKKQNQRLPEIKLGSVNEGLGVFKLEPEVEVSKAVDIVTDKQPENVNQ